MMVMMLGTCYEVSILPNNLVHRGGKGKVSGAHTNVRHFYIGAEK